MALDTRRFLDLTLLLAASACAKRTAEPVIPAPVSLAPNPPEYTTPMPPPPPEELPTAVATVSEPDVEPSCNDGGDVSSCDLLNPSCESGAASFCREEAPLRTGIREAFATCIRKAEKGGRCAPATSPRSCLKQAISKGCIDPIAQDRCKTLMSECKAAGKQVRYDLATCAKILSAVTVHPGSPYWPVANLELLGPTAEGRSCSLDYVLPFYPFGH